MIERENALRTFRVVDVFIADIMMSCSIHVDVFHSHVHTNLVHYDHKIPEV